MIAKEITPEGQVRYNYECPGCKAEGEIEVNKNEKRPLACPEECGTYFFQWIDNGIYKLQPLVISHYK